MVIELLAVKRDEIEVGPFFQAVADHSVYPVVVCAVENVEVLDVHLGVVESGDQYHPIQTDEGVVFF